MKRLREIMSSFKKFSFKRMKVFSVYITECIILVVTFSDVSTLNLGQFTFF